VGVIETGDFREMAVPAADLVIVDPPYGLRKEYDGERETTSYEEWVEAIIAATSAPWTLIFGPPIPTIDYARLAPTRVIVWTKTFAQIRKSLKGWQYGVTPILVYRRDDAPWYGGSTLPGAWDYIAAPSAMTDVATVRRLLGEATHPGVTGRAIAKKLIPQLTGPGDLVVDPMAGTGSLLVAARELGRRVWGAELSPVYADVARRWLDE
jgi:DNA modification methylase